MSESKRYIDLAGLLNQNRDVKKSHQVEEILKTDISIHEKIEKIKEIDSSDLTNEKNTGEESSESFFSGPVAEKKDETAEFENFITAKKAEKNRDSIKLRIKENDFFSFIFSDFRKIIAFSHKWGRREDIIRYSYFPPRIRINRRIQVVFEQTTIKFANEIKPVLKKVLSTGWMHLDKFEYNLIVVFDNLCNIVVGLNFRRFDLNSSDTVDNIQLIENLFLTCRSDAIYPILISSAISNVIDKHPEWMYDKSKMSSIAHKILDQKPLRPSLYNIILILNMIKYKRFLDFYDIIKKNKQEIIATFDFDADHEVRMKINAFVSIKKNDLEMCIRKKNDFEKISRFLEFNDKSGLDYSFMEKQYASFGSPARNLNDDREFPAEYISYLSSMFIRHFEEILSGQIEIQSGKKVRIFSADFFQYEISKIRLENIKLAKYNYLFKKVSRDRYHAIASTRKSGTQSEIELLHVLSEVQLQMKGICEKLIGVITSHVRNSQSVIEEENAEEFAFLSDSKDRNKPLTPGDLSKMDCLIPYSEEKIEGQIFISGLTVSKVLNNITGICLYSQGVMGDSEFLSAISSSQGVYKDISALAEILKKVTSVSDYKKIEKLLK